jgi:putative flavoprotein involved in K+ transport
MPFPADPWSYPGKDQVGDYLEAYADSFELPIANGVRVEEVARNGSGYVVSCNDRRIEAENVVVATGTFGRPYTPSFAAELDPAIVQLHSSEYRNLSQLRNGPVLVVGASHSGSDVAYEAAGAHPTVLSGRDTGQIPFPVESKRMRAAFPLITRIWNHVLTIRTPPGRKERSEIRAHGGPLLRHRRKELARAGVERVLERVSGVDNGQPVLEGGKALDVANVIWCTGFRQRFDWIRPPVTGEDGWPLETRGVVPDVPGLYFTGLAFQYAFSSMLLLGVGRDAEHVASKIAG